MKSDREMLELAARAAGIWVGDDEFADPIGRKYSPGLGLWVHVGQMEDMGRWLNPLNSDGDALRLAVKLELEIRVFNGKAHAGKQDKFWCTEIWFPDGDVNAATRRAIVRAAAKLAEAVT